MTERRPDPRSATTPAEFLHALQRLRAWAGRPSLRTLTRLAGTVEVPGRPPADVLPVSTLSDNLNGKRLPNPPRHGFVVAFVTACLRAHGDTATDIAAELDRWTEALQAVSAPPAPAADPQPAATADANTAAPSEPDKAATETPSPPPTVAETPERVFPDEITEPFVAEIPAERTIVLAAKEPSALASAESEPQRRPSLRRSRKTQKRRAKPRPVPIVTAILGAAIGAAAVWGLMPSHGNAGSPPQQPPGAAVSPSGGSAAGNSGPSGRTPQPGQQTPAQGGPGVGGTGNGPKIAAPSGNTPQKKQPSSNDPSTAGGDTQTAKNPATRPSFQIPGTSPSGAFDPRKEAGKYDPNKFKWPTPPAYP